LWQTRLLVVGSHVNTQAKRRTRGYQARLCGRAEVGDSVAIYIKDLQVTSIATSSGKDVVIEGRYEGDPFVAKRCPAVARKDPRPE